MAVVAALCATLAFVPAPASPDTGLNAGTGTDRAVRSDDTGLDVALQLPMAGPYRAMLLADPPRLAIDIAAAMAPRSFGRPFRAHSLADGRVRLEMSLPGPMAIERAAMASAGQGARLSLRLVRVASSDFSAVTATEPGQPLPAGASDRLTIALDPGHGGHDPGATHGRLHEADLMLLFARELKADLLRTTDFDVVLTRTEDRFVPLRKRRALAREAGADLFLSLHADGIEWGSASGATVFTHGQGGGHAASVQLAGALRQGGHGHGDAAGQLVSHSGPAPNIPYRSRDLAAALIDAMAAAELPLYKHPRQEADFVVLRARDIPSVLVELGFLTEPEDRARIVDPGWRSRMAASLRRGVLRWADQDAAFAALRPQ